MHITENNIFNAAFADELVKIANADTHTEAFEFLKEAGLTAKFFNFLRHPALKAQEKFHRAAQGTHNALARLKWWQTGSMNSLGKAESHGRKATQAVETAKKIDVAKIDEIAAKQLRTEKAERIGWFKKKKQVKEQYSPTIARQERARTEANIRAGYGRKNRVEVAKLKEEKLKLKELEKKRKAKNMFSHLGRGVVGTGGSDTAATAAGMAMVGIPSYVAGKYMISSTQRPTERVKLGEKIVMQSPEGPVAQVEPSDSLHYANQGFTHLKKYPLKMVNAKQDTITAVSPMDSLIHSVTGKYKPIEIKMKEALPEKKETKK